MSNNVNVLNDTQVELLKSCVKVARLRKAHKGYRFLGEGELYKKFSKELRILAHPVCITGVNRDFDMAKETEFKYSPVEMTEEEMELLKGELAEDTLGEDDKDKLLSRKAVSKAQVDMFKSEFEMAVSEYNLEVEEMTLLQRVSGTKLLVKFSSNEELCSFSMELPFIDKVLSCRVNGNLYSMAYMPLNLIEYANGTDEVLKLVHPYQFLIKQGLMTSAKKSYSKDFFIGMMKRSQGGLIKAVQANITRTLRNAKEYSWSEVNKTPIMWVDSNKSEVGKFLLENNIQLDLSYAELVSVHGIKGIDIITGSTSAPGKRCKVAKNYYIRKNAGVFEMVRNEKSTEDVFDVANIIKTTIYPCFVKTSAKRDNSATIKDTCDLVMPFTYKKRFTVKE